MKLRGLGKLVRGCLRTGKQREQRSVAHLCGNPYQLVVSEGGISTFPVGKRGGGESKERVKKLLFHPIL